ncbi:MAG: hypothetical protein QXE22_03055 [Candidatus Bathyarchaeia archaeon]
MKLSDQRCPICGARSPQSEYCAIHEEAYEKLRLGYDVWLKAFDGKLEFKDYLEKVYGLKETGLAVKAVIEHLRVRSEIEA